MLTHEDLEILVKDITYRPDWTFMVRKWQLAEALRGYDPEESVPVLDIFAVVPDSRDLQPTTVAIARVTPKGARQSPAAFLDWVKGLLLEFEYHELREFFKYKGELVDDPHASTPVRSDT